MNAPLTTDPKLARHELNLRIELAAKKRDHACDVLGKPLLGMTYQMEIDRLVEQLGRVPK
jgi:hypothetical protein